MFSQFAKHFKEVCAPHSEHRNTELKAVYTEIRSSYVSLMDFVEHESGRVFDVQLLSELIAKMKRCKAAGLDELSVEHLIYCHPVVVILLCKLFNFYRAMPRKRGLCCHAVSVRLSVRLSRSWITSKRINISSKFFHLRVATPF